MTDENVPVIYRLCRTDGVIGFNLIPFTEEYVDILLDRIEKVSGLLKLPSFKDLAVAEFYDYTPYFLLGDDDQLIDCDEEWGVEALEIKDVFEAGRTLKDFLDGKATSLFFTETWWEGETEDAYDWVSTVLERCEVAGGTSSNIYWSAETKHGFERMEAPFLHKDELIKLKKKFEEIRGVTQEEA